MLRIITECNNDDHWTAWTAGSPQNAFGGPTPATAVARLMQSLGRAPETLAVDYDACGDGHMEFTLAAKPCPDCGGSGQYIGLNLVETCERCGGCGWT